MPYSVALRSNRRRQQVSEPVKLPAPTKGWYTASSIAAAPKQSALVIENWFCEPDALRLRGGFQEHASGLHPTSPVETLMVYTSGTEEKFFAAAGSRIFDITSPGAQTTGDAVVTGRDNARNQFTNVATPGGQFLMICNGSDDVLTYDGSSWDDTSGITGVAPADLTNIWQYKERVWFTELGTADAWYLAANAITGAANSLACGSFLTKGGYLVAGINWSVSDAGDGKDDLLLVISSEGEALVFTGTDPANPNAWDYLGNYQVGKPIGRRCLFKVGGDVLIITEGGLIPVSKAITLDKAVFSTASMTKNFTPDYADFVRRYGSNFGWQMETLPASNMAVLNVPTAEGEEADQIVWNVATGAPSRFTGIPAVCWCFFAGDLYFGAADGTVYKAETGASDNGEDIVAYLLPAYDDLGSPATMKHVKLVKPIFESDILVSPEISIAVDYTDPVTFAASALDDSAVYFTWDTTPWDTYPWLGTQVFRPWQSGNNIGAAISPATRVTVEDGGDADDLVYRLFAYHIVYEDGGIVG